MAAHNELGRWGEDLAAEYLRSKDYVIIDRDWHSGHRDLDIIAEDDDVVVFVEVKTRRNNIFGDPEEAIDFRKQRSLQLAINHYVKANHIRKEIRFDIIAVTGTPETKPDIRHIQNVALL